MPDPSVCPILARCSRSLLFMSVALSFRPAAPLAGMSSRQYSFPTPCDIVATSLNPVECPVFRLRQASLEGAALPLYLAGMAKTDSATAASGYQARLLATSDRSRAEVLQLVRIDGGAPAFFATSVDRFVRVVPVSLLAAATGASDTKFDLGSDGIGVLLADQVYPETDPEWYLDFVPLSGKAAYPPEAFNIRFTSAVSRLLAVEQTGIDVEEDEDIPIVLCPIHTCDNSSSSWVLEPQQKEDSGAIQPLVPLAVSPPALAISDHDKLVMFSPAEQAFLGRGQEAAGSPLVPVASRSAAEVFRVHKYGQNYYSFESASTGDFLIVVREEDIGTFGYLAVSEPVFDNAESFVILRATADAFFTGQELVDWSGLWGMRAVTRVPVESEVFVGDKGRVDVCDLTCSADGREDTRVGSPAFQMFQFFPVAVSVDELDAVHSVGALTRLADGALVSLRSPRTNTYMALRDHPEYEGGDRMCGADLYMVSSRSDAEVFRLSLGVRDGSVSLYSTTKDRYIRLLKPYLESAEHAIGRLSSCVNGIPLRADRVVSGLSTNTLFDPFKLQEYANYTDTFWILRSAKWPDFGLRVDAELRLSFSSSADGQKQHKEKKSEQEQEQEEEEAGGAADSQNDDDHGDCEEDEFEFVAMLPSTDQANDRLGRDFLASAPLSTYALSIHVDRATPLCGVLYFPAADMFMPPLFRVTAAYDSALASDLALRGFSRRSEAGLFSASVSRGSLAAAAASSVGLSLRARPGSNTTFGCLWNPENNETRIGFYPDASGWEVKALEVSMLDRPAAVETVSDDSKAEWALLLRDSLALSCGDMRLVMHENGTVSSASRISTESAIPSTTLLSAVQFYPLTDSCESFFAPSDGIEGHSMIHENAAQSHSSSQGVVAGTGGSDAAIIDVGPDDADKAQQSLPLWAIGLCIAGGVLGILGALACLCALSYRRETQSMILEYEVAVRSCASGTGTITPGGGLRLPAQVTYRLDRGRGKPPNLPTIEELDRIRSDLLTKRISSHGDLDSHNGAFSDKYTDKDIIIDPYAHLEALERHRSRGGLWTRTSGGGDPSSQSFVSPSLSSRQSSASGSESARAPTHWWTREFLARQQQAHMQQ